MFIHLLARLYLLPFCKLSRAKVNNRADRHLLDSFSRFIDTSVGVSNFRLVILQRQRHTKNRVKLLRWSFFGKIEDCFLVVKNSTVLPHYSRKIKYLENIFKITLKKRRSFVIEGENLH